MRVQRSNQATIRIGGMAGILMVLGGCTSNHSLHAASRQTQALETQTTAPQAPSSGTGAAYPTATPSDLASAPPFVTDRSEGPAMVLLEGSGQVAATFVYAATIRSASLSAGAAPTATPAKHVEVATIKIYARSGSSQYSATDFTFVGSDGHTYAPADTSIGSTVPDPRLGSGQLQAGQSVEGIVAFIVPPGGGKLELSSDQLSWATGT